MNNYIGINWNIKLLKLKDTLSKLRNINARLMKRNTFLFKQNNKLKERIKKHETVQR